MRRALLVAATLVLIPAAGWAQVKLGPLQIQNALSELSNVQPTVWGNLGLPTSAPGQPNGLAVLDAEGGIQQPTETVRGGVFEAAAGASQVMTGIGSTGAPTFANLPAPTTSLLGGVLSAAAPTNEFMTGLNTSGAPTFVQPAFSNLSGVATPAQLPAATTGALGAVSISAGLGVSAGAVSVLYGATSGTATQGNDPRVVNAYPYSTVASAGLNPLPVGSALYNWGQGFPTTATANVTSPLGFYINNGPILANNPMTYGIEDNAVVASFIANAPPNSGASDNLHPQVMGSLFSPPSRLALYTSRDSVGVYGSDTWTAPLITDVSATYDATHYYPGTPLSATIVGQLRDGMIVDAGTMPFGPKWAGAVTAWASNGTSITVQGWYAVNNTASGQVPTAGSTAYVNPMTGITALNVQAVVPSGAAPWALAQGVEIDMGMYGGNTNPQITDQNQSWALNIENGATYAAHSGVIVNGKFLIGYSAGTGSFAGFVAAPNAGFGGTMQTGYFAGGVSTTGFQSSNAVSGALAFEADAGGGLGAKSFSVTNAGAVDAVTYTNGIVNIYPNLASVFPTGGSVTIGQNYTSGASEMDFMNMTSGAGTSFGFYQNRSGTYSNVANITPAGLIEAKSGFEVLTSTGVTCTGTPTAEFATVGGIVTHC